MLEEHTKWLTSHKSLLTNSRRQSDSTQPEHNDQDIEMQRSPSPVKNRQLAFMLVILLSRQVESAQCAKLALPKDV